MTKAKSTTKKESVEFDVEKIRRFTENELDNLANANNPLPFCYQIGNLLMVGHYKISKINDKCWRVSDKTGQIFDFFTRKDAIFYCIALHKQNIQIANDIKTNDDLLGKLDFEAILFRHRYKQAKEKENTWEMELYSNKYLITMARMAHVKKELQKTLNLAKYIKV